MSTFIVKFAPISDVVYEYEVEAQDDFVAEFIALDDFRNDIGYDRSKDFECINVEKENDDE